MSDSLFVEVAESLAWVAPKHARGTVVDGRVTPQAKRSAVVALLLIPRPKGLIRKMGTRSLSVVISAAASRPFVADISRHLRPTIFELWRADLSHFEGDGGSLRRDVLVRAHLFARLPPVAWPNLFSNFEDVRIFTPGDLESVPLSELHLVTGPNIPGDVRRELCAAAHAFGPRSDQLVNIRPFSGARPILDAFSMAGDLKGKTAEDSELGSHRRCEAQSLSLDDAAAPLGAQ